MDQGKPLEITTFLLFRFTNIFDLNRTTQLRYTDLVLFSFYFLSIMSSGSTREVGNLYTLLYSKAMLCKKKLFKKFKPRKYSLLILFYLNSVIFV